MKRSTILALALCLLAAIAGCGSSNNNPANVGLFGNWNITMYPTNNPNPAYVFALAMSQEGTSTYSGASIRYTGGVAVPPNMCIDPNSLRATATTGTNNTFTMTITDTSTDTIISVTGSLTSQTTSLTGNYTNPSSNACPQSSGTMTMTPQG